MVKLSAAEKRRPLYWRVAAVDTNGNVGSYASGSFAAPKAKSKQKAKRRPSKRHPRKK